MAATDRIFAYCERGSDASFWAEPLNAVSNAAFILAALAAAHGLRQRGAGQPAAVATLIFTVFAIGIGSFLFHTYATRWAALADVLPILVFMLAYLGYALRTYLGLAWVWIAVMLGGFVWGLHLAGAIECRALFGIAAFSHGPCLNGTLRYAPAFVALLATAALLAFLRHPAAVYLGGAGLVFLVSMTFRSVDFALCDQTRFFGPPLGTHALWHLCNAATLYILLLAAIRHGRPPGAIASGRARAHKVARPKRTWWNW